MQYFKYEIEWPAGLKKFKLLGNLAALEKSQGIS